MSSREESASLPLRNEKSLRHVPEEALYWNIGHGREPIPGSGSAHNQEHKRAGRLHQFVILSLLLLSFHCWRLFARISSKGDINRCNTEVLAAGPSAFNWSAHPPSKVLNWTECFSYLQCTRLSVPLLYSERSDEEAAVALIMHPSIYPPGHEKYKGPVLFNPGGPGVSGIQLLVPLWQAFRTILGDEFDLVSFDPRGVGATTPNLKVFNDQVEMGRFLERFPLNMNASTSEFGEAYSRAKILANLVEDRARFVAERVSTPIVAQDMLSIVKAFGQDKLQYWGFSYGTILGATFAAMFPDNVGRVIIDGVVDTEDYYKGTWANNLRDTDAALLDIYEQCVSAGPSECPMYETDASLVNARVDRLLERLKTEPLAYYDNSNSLGLPYEIIDYGSVRHAIFMTLHSTHSAGSPLVHALAALEKGDTSQLLPFTDKVVVNKLLECTCPASGETPIPYQGPEITYSIGCGDRIDNVQEDLETLREAYEKMAKMSSFATLWSPRISCSSWKLRTKEPLNASFEQTTSHPLLLIGNTADPVTPLWNAHKVSKGFKDSVVLTQNSSGHCSIAATSLCTYKAVREYFVNGTLPEKGTVCQTESSIFGGKAYNLDTLSAEDKELVAASDMLRENYFITPFGIDPIRSY